MSKPLIEKLKDKKDIITVTRNRKNISTITSYADVLIPFETAQTEGNKLALKDGSIKIGKEVSKVLVSANCQGVQVKLSDKNISIKKGNSGIMPAYISGDTTNGYFPICISNVVVEVQEGDVISLQINSQKAETLDLMKCTLTVEVIE